MVHLHSRVKTQQTFHHLQGQQHLHHSKDRVHQEVQGALVAQGGLASPRWIKLYVSEVLLGFPLKDCATRLGK